MVTFITYSNTAMFNNVFLGIHNSFRPGKLSHPCIMVCQGSPITDWKYQVGCHGYDHSIFNIKVDLTSL